MADSLSAVSDLEPARSLAECPICLEIPRDGLMLQCKNGHNVCAECKDQICIGARCPHGRCEFLDPPTPNRTVAGLVEKYPFVFPCKYAFPIDDNHSSCLVRATEAALQRHERDCEHRSVACRSCKHPVSVGKLIEHLEQAHKVAPERRRARSSWVQVYFVYNPMSSGPVAWAGRPFILRSGCVFPTACYFQDGRLYVWLQMLAPASVTEKLECVVYVAEDGVHASALDAHAPVYPIDWTHERIMADEECTSFSSSRMRKMLVESNSEQYSKMGFCSRFWVAFKIVEKSE